ncbi:MAG: hypothetical protein KDA79_02550 [Planctomycetaceae bacterium]|nr:hypothetical protein [Planctomycetaceae bacterium]
MTIPAYRDPAGFSSSYHQQIYTVHHPVPNGRLLPADPVDQAAPAASPELWNLDSAPELPAPAGAAAALPRGAGSD